MTQTYRTDDFARWGVGQGFNLSPTQVDINFWDLAQRMIAQEARPDPSAGIAYFEIVGIMLYVHMTDATVLGPYELPVATFRDRGEWAPEVSYSKMDTFSINGGLYVVIFSHTSDVTFDAGANDGEGHGYYQLMLQNPDASYDAAIFIPGSVQRAAGELLFQAVANRVMNLASGSGRAYAYLDAGIGAGTNIILSIQKNRIEVGTITFIAGATLDAGGGQSGTFNIPAAVAFAEGDTYAIRVTASNNAVASGLSITLPFLRTDL